MASQNQIAQVVEKSATDKKKVKYGSHLCFYIVLIAHPRMTMQTTLKHKICGSLLKHHKSYSGTTHLRTHFATCTNTSENVTTSTKIRQTKVTGFCKQAKPTKFVNE